MAENDDRSRHGVLIPKASYGFFPELPIPNPAENSKVAFSARDRESNEVKHLSWIYYHRYPERRITRVSPQLDERGHGRRLIIFTRFKLASGQSVYFVDVAVEHLDQRFASLTALFFGAAPKNAGAYVVLPLDAPQFVIDDDLSELLERFDRVKAMGWIDSRRSGHTGIGHTFESLVGIEENNHQIADFRGIEVKCKLRNESASPSGKINLFQLAPRWTIPGPNLKRLGVIGTPNAEGILSCYSQVTTTPNNKELWLRPSSSIPSLDMFKSEEMIGQWGHEKLSKRLSEKHSRAVFVSTKSQTHGGRTQYRYTDLLYCERPHIDRFVALVAARRIVFEFTMRLSIQGRVRNHGYPWRLVDERDLEQLFAFQIQLRQDPR